MDYIDLFIYEPPTREGKQGRITKFVLKYLQGLRIVVRTCAYAIHRIPGVWVCAHVSCMFVYCSHDTGEIRTKSYIFVP